MQSLSLNCKHIKKSILKIIGSRTILPKDNIPESYFLSPNLNYKQENFNELMNPSELVSQCLRRSLSTIIKIMMLLVYLDSFNGTMISEKSKFQKIYLEVNVFTFLLP